MQLVAVKQFYCIQCLIKSKTGNMTEIPRSADKLVDLILNTPGVLDQVKASPENRTHIMQTVDVFRARIVDVTNESFIVEVTGDEGKIEGLTDVLAPFGIIEMVRTGMVSMARGVAPNPAAAQNGNGNGYKKQDGED